MSSYSKDGYDVDVSLKKVKGKVAKPSKIKLMVKRKKKKQDKGYHKINRSSSNNLPAGQGSSN